MAETRYGFLSDIHEEPRKAEYGFAKLRKEGAEKIVLNGDVCDWTGNVRKSQDRFAYVLGHAGKTGLQIFVQPGSHEPVQVFHPVMEYFSKKFSNLVNVLESPGLKEKDHDLVFIPGSDFLSHGEYQIGNGAIKTGMYIATKDGLMLPEEFDKISELERDPEATRLYYSNMQDIKKNVSRPEQTIAVCHVPRKFDSLEHAVDMAHFVEQIDFNFRMENFKNDEKYAHYFKSSAGVFPAALPAIITIERTDPNLFMPCSHHNPSEEEIENRARDYFKKNDVNIVRVYVEQKANRGNEDLKNLYNRLGIKKAVTGHFHESFHRANDLTGNHVPEGAFVDELFWNASHNDEGKAGILTVKDGKVKYQNINF